MLEHGKTPHTSHTCTICSEVFQDELLLRTHEQLAHYLSCSVCGKDHKTRESLNIHTRSCNQANLSVGTTSTELVPFHPPDQHGTPQDPLLLIVDALANPAGTTQDALQRIKSLILKEKHLSQHIESHKAGADKSFIELPSFSSETPLTIPNGRLKSLPKFNPQDNKPVQNYASFTHLISELNSLIIEYRCSEQQYLSMMVQQYSDAAKIQLKSILNVTLSLQSVPLERVFESNRILFYDVDLAQVYSHSTNLSLNPGENILQFYARASSITRLGSYFLDNPEQMEAFRSSNMRLALLMAAGKRFSDLIRTRELQQKIIYCPSEILRIFLEWSKGETQSSRSPNASINQVYDVPLDSFVYGALGNGGKKNRGGRGGGRGGTGRGSGGRGGTGRGRGGRGNAQKGQGDKQVDTSSDKPNINQVSPATDTSRDRVRSQGRGQPATPGGNKTPPKYSEATLRKRRALNITDDRVVCFLCGDAHFPSKCKMYQGAKVQDQPCNSCIYYHEPRICRRNGRRN